MVQKVFDKNKLLSRNRESLKDMNLHVIILLLLFFVKTTLDIPNFMSGASFSEKMVIVSHHLTPELEFSNIVYQFS